MTFLQSSQNGWWQSMKMRYDDHGPSAPSDGVITKFSITVRNWRFLCQSTNNHNT